VRRRYGSGSVFPRPDGKWIAQWDMPREDGRRRRRQLVADTEAQAWKRMSTERASPSKARPRAGTVGEFLERWLEDVVRVTRRERTYVGYRAIVSALPVSVTQLPLGHPRLGHETQAHLSALPRHPRTVAHHAACLRTAFGYAVRKRMIDHNPAADLDLPRIPRTERVPLTAEQLKRLLEFTGGRDGRGALHAGGAPVSDAGRTERRPAAGGPTDGASAQRGVPRVPSAARPLVPREARSTMGRATASVLSADHALYVTAAFTGLRQGELLGLRWEDVDLRRATLTVRHSLTRLPGRRYVLTEPKTERSRRTIPLLPPVVEALTELRRSQMERATIGGRDVGAQTRVEGRPGLGLGTDREGSGVFPVPGPATRPARTQTQAPLNQGLVFCDEQGRALDGSLVTKRFQRTLEAAGLPPSRFHDIRHACATMLIENGVDLATVAAILGHSTIVITTSTYDHVRGGRTQAALGTLMERIG
jgi:integrase